MRKIMTVGMAAALFVALALVPGSALARKHACPTSARADRNHDRIPDRWECKHRLSLKVNQARHDQDRDGLNNRGEFQAGDNPRDADSDDDGVRDGAEHAGTIAGPVDPATGLLTINLAGGGTVTAKVVAGVTRVKCENERETAAHASRDGGSDDTGSSSGPSSSSGPGSDSSHGPTTAGRLTTTAARTTRRARLR